MHLNDSSSEWATYALTWISFFSSPKFTFSANLVSHNICVNFCDLEMRGIAMSILHIRLKPKRAIHNSTQVEFNCTRVKKGWKVFNISPKINLSIDIGTRIKISYCQRHNTFFSSSLAWDDVYSRHIREIEFTFSDLTSLMLLLLDHLSLVAEWNDIFHLFAAVFYISSRGFRVDMRRIHTFW